MLAAPKPREGGSASQYGPHPPPRATEAAMLLVRRGAVLWQECQELRPVRFLEMTALPCILWPQFAAA